MSLHDAGVSLIDCVHKTPAAAPTGYPYIAIPQIKNGRIDFSDARRISPSDFAEWTKKARPRIYDVVLSRRTNPGVTAVFGTECDFALGQNLVLLRADGSHVAPEFLRWLVVSPPWWAQTAKYNNVGAVFDSLKCADVPRFELPIPPMNVQRQIAALLGSIDDKIDLNRRMNETLEAMTRAIFKDWFVDFGPVRAKMEGRDPPGLAPEIAALFPDRFGEDGVPKGWHRDVLLQLCQLKRGYDLPSRQRSPGNYPIISSSGTTDYHDKYAVRGPGVVTGRYGTIGNVYFVESDFWPLNTALYVSDFKGNEPRFVYHVLSMIEYNNYSDKAAVPGVNRNHLHTAPVIVPPKEVQQAFVRLLSPMWSLQLASRSEAKTLAALRDLLLPKLMSGELRVRDAEELVEEAA